LPPVCHCPTRWLLHFKHPFHPQDQSQSGYRL
jgi:hypothetical protein